MVVMVSSLGGLEPMAAVLGGLPANFPLPVLVVRHARATDDLDRLTRLLASRTRLPVRTGGNGRLAQAGVTVIPPGETARLDSSDCLLLCHTDGTAHDGDELLCSASAKHGSATIAVILSGTGRDGTRGVRAVKRAGGRTLAQDPSTADSHQMPASAIASGCVDFVLGADRISTALVALVMAPGAGEFLTVATPSWANLAD